MATQSHLFSFPVRQPVEALMEDSLTDSAADDNGKSAPWTVAITDPGLDLARKTVCIKVRLSSMGNTRKVSSSQIEAAAHKELLPVSQQLVDSAELNALSQLYSA